MLFWSCHMCTCGEKIRYVCFFHALIVPHNMQWEWSDCVWQLYVNITFLCHGQKKKIEQNKPPPQKKPGEKKWTYTSVETQRFPQKQDIRIEIWLWCLTPVAVASVPGSRDPREVKSWDLVFLEVHIKQTTRVSELGELGRGPKSKPQVQEGDLETSNNNTLTLNLGKARSLDYNLFTVGHWAKSV